MNIATVKAITSAAQKANASFTFVTDENYSFLIDPNSPHDFFRIDEATGLMYISKRTSGGDFLGGYEKINSVTVMEVERILFIELFYERNESSKKAVSDIFKTDFPALSDFMDNTIKLK